MCHNVYISFAKCTEVKEERILMKDVAEIWCADESVLSGIKSFVIARAKGDRDQVYTFTAISIIKLLHQKFPDITINNLGDPEFMVVYHYKKSPNIFWQFVKIAFVCAIVFAGGAFAIMAYGNDIDISNLFGSITEFFTGDPENKTIIIEVAYSVGLSTGIILFFNNFGKRKQPKDPTPIQVSMRNYEEELYKTIIENNVREGKMGDGD